MHRASEGWWGVLLLISTVASILAHGHLVPFSRPLACSPTGAQTATTHASRGTVKGGLGKLGRAEGGRARGEPIVAPGWSITPSNQF
jgi:hypothetical protein